jgi:hypothetical protein
MPTELCPKCLVESAEEQEAMGAGGDAYKHLQLPTIEAWRERAEAAERERDAVIQRATRLLAPGCAQWCEEVRKLTFSEFVALVEGQCLHCLKRERDEARRLAVKLRDLFCECYGCGADLIMDGLMPFCEDTCDPEGCSGDDSDPRREWDCEVRNALVEVERFRTELGVVNGGAR